MPPTAVTGAVPIELDRPRTLKADLNALCAIEERTGLNLLADGVSLQSARHARAFLWALLRHEDPDLTEEQVGGFISAANLPGIMQTIGEAFAAAMPEAEPEAPEGAETAGKGRASRTPG